MRITQKPCIGSVAPKRGTVIRYETWEDGTVVALRENEIGDRWYETIIDKNGNHTF
jgi:hypothetical protein